MQTVSIGTLPSYTGTIDDFRSMFMAIGYSKEFNAVQNDTFRISVSQLLSLMTENYPVATYLQKGLTQLVNIETVATEYDPNTGEPITKYELADPSAFSDHFVANAKTIITALSHCLREGGDIDGAKCNILLEELTSNINLDKYLKERELAALVVRDQTTGTTTGQLIYRLAGDDKNGNPRYITFASSNDINSIWDEIKKIEASIKTLTAELDNKYDKTGGPLYGTITFHVPTTKATGIEEILKKDYIAFNSSDASVPENTLLGTGVQLRRSGTTGKWTMSVDNMIVRSSMYVPTLIIDETYSVGGSMVISPGHGNVTKVDSETRNGVSYYKLWIDQEITYDNEGNAIYKNNPEMQFRDGDFVKCTKYQGPGWNDTGYLKSYWLPISYADRQNGYILIEAKYFDAEYGTFGLPAVEDELVVFGNATTPARQSVILITASESQSPLIATYAGLNQNTNTRLSQCLVVAEGNIEGIVTDTGETLHGIGMYIKGNSYICGRLHQVSGDGQTVVPVPCYKGEYDPYATYYVGDEVTYFGELWRFLGDADHQTITGKTPDDEPNLWIKVLERGEQGDGAYYIYIESSQGSIFRNGRIDTTLTARVKCGQVDITNWFDPSEIRWTRVSGRESDIPNDPAWNWWDPLDRIRYKHTGPTLHIDKTDVTYKATFNVEAVDDPNVSSPLNISLRQLINDLSK